MAMAARWGRLLLVFTAAISMRTSALLASSDYLSVKDPPYQARGDGLSDDSAAIQLAISDAVANNRGTVFFPPGIYVCASSLTIPPHSQGIVLLGVGSATSGLGLSSLIKFTSPGSESLLIAQRTSGTTLRSLAIGYGSPAFSGTLIDFDSEPGKDDTSFAVIDDCYIGGLGGAAGASVLMSLNHSSRIGVYRCNVTGGVVGVRGRSMGDYSNIVRIVDCRFGNLRVAIKNAGEGWIISGNGFVATPSGIAAGYDQDPGVCANGTTFFGNWFGDVSAGGTWIRYCGNNLSLIGNHVMGDRASVGVQIVGSSNYGISIHGNEFGNHSVAVALGRNQSGISIQGNTFGPSVGTPIQGVSDHDEVIVAGNNGAGGSMLNLTGSIVSSGIVRAGALFSAGAVIGAGSVQGSAVIAAVRNVGSVIGSGSGSDLVNQIRPNPGRNGWLTFTEDGIADRWVAGIRGGDTNLYFGTGGPSSQSTRVVFNAIGIGVGGVVPQVSLDAAGAIATRSSTIVLQDGVNSDVPIKNQGYVRVMGPSAPFSIGGIQAGVDGQLLVLYNASGRPMTIRDEDASSAATNRVRTSAGSDLTIGRRGAATLIYDAGESRWVLVSSS